MTPIILAAIAGTNAFLKGQPPIASLDTKLRQLIATSQLCAIKPMLAAWYQSYEHEQRMAEFGFQGYDLTNS